MEERESALELWRRWTSALMTGLDTEVDGGTRTLLMEHCGRACALHHRDVERVKAIRHGVKGIDELLDRLNQLEDFWCGTWTRDGAIIHSVCGKCGCPLVRAGWVGLSPTFCDCSRGWTKEIFEIALERPVEVELKRAIGRGDRVCEFVVRFDKKSR
jgi:hypothetical protein